MASIFQVGEYWHIRYYQNRKPVQYSLRTKNKNEARYKKNQIENDLIRGATLPDNCTALADVYALYLSSIKGRIAPRTYETYKGYLDPFIVPRGHLPIGTVTEKDLEEYLAEKKRHPRTANHMIRYTKSLMIFAVRRNFIETNPLKNMRRYRVDVTPPRFLSKEEIRRLFAAAEGETLYPMIATAIYTGMRLGELKRFTLDDVDFQRKTIMVPKAKSRRFREIPLHPDLEPVLASMKEKSFTVVNMRRVFRRVLKRAGLFGGTGWHTFRHTFASQLLHAGVGLAAVSRLLGHSDIRTTEIYGHFEDRHMTEYVGKLKF